MRHWAGRPCSIVIPVKAMKKKTKRPWGKEAPVKAPAKSLHWAWGHYLLLAIGLAFTSYVRWRYLQLPLERDEGEFGYIAQRILNGLSPFEAYNYKLPGVPFVYALFMRIFGQTISAIHIALLAANLGAALILFACFRKVIGNWWAAIASIIFSLFTLDLTVLGTAAHATQFVCFFMLAGLFFLLRDKQNPANSFLAGLMMGASFVMKQPAFLFVPAGAVFLLILRLKNKPIDRLKTLTHLLVYGSGTGLPYLAIVGAALRHDQFGLFWKWTFTYPMYYISSLAPAQGWDNFKIVFGEIVGRFPWLWLMAGIGLAALVICKGRPVTHRVLVPLLLMVSAAAITPGYYFHHHYFILLMPAVAICVGRAFGYVSDLLGRYTSASGILSVGLFVLLAGAGIFSEKGFYFSYTNDEYLSIRYLHNPFREATKVADYIQSITSAEDKILVVGSEAEIYFYTGRAPASGYLFVHGMVSRQPKNLEMQNEFIAEAERTRPEVMVLCGVGYSWLAQPGTPDAVLRWFDGYAAAHYEITGMVDMLDQGTLYRWGSETKNYRPQADNYLVVYKRKKDSSAE